MIPLNVHFVLYVGHSRSGHLRPKEIEAHT
jgi:hypothetical protein